MQTQKPFVSLIRAKPLNLLYVKLHRIIKFINSSIFICVYLRLSAVNYS